VVPGKAWFELRVAILLVAVRLVLPRIGLAATLKRFARPGPSPSVAARRNGGAVDVVGQSAVEAVQRAARRTGGGTCLAQSVVLTALLIRTGADPEVVLGCRRYQDGHWGAHAWVELDGRLLEPVRADEHTELTRCRASAGWKLDPTR
jgi:hypothetical protein